ncbi:hypothetical protein EV283_3208 [Sphingomonas sp. BK036]|nr:hypothetical protein EV283_3208 [Sphingomonas sp. BK036]
MEVGLSLLPSPNWAPAFAGVVEWWWLPNSSLYPRGRNLSDGQRTALPQRRAV